MDAVEVDGSQGEGGGQILRTAVTFSVIGRVPVRVVKIRAGRGVPGLKRQHVSALRILASVFGGSVEGATEGSTTVSFVPGTPSLESYSVDMGTAASITLVLQAVVPAVALSGSSLSLTLTGGTDVPWSPTFDYFQSVVLRGYRAIGIEADADSPRRGYYPRGGGQVTASIRPCSRLTPLDLTVRSDVKGAVVTSRCGMLPRSVAERQAQAASEWLRRAGIKVEREEVSEEKSLSPGSSILVSSTGPGLYIGADAVGARGKRAEEVGSGAAGSFASILASGACLDANLADMLIPLLSFAHGRSQVMIPAVTPHLESGLHLAEQFTSCSWSARREGRGVLVGISPRSG